MGADPTVEAVQAQLQAIEASIQAGRSPEHFAQALDILLGTGLQDRDEDLEEAWELGQRSRVRPGP